MLLQRACASARRCAFAAARSAGRLRVAAAQPRPHPVGGRELPCACRCSLAAPTGPARRGLHGLCIAGAASEERGGARGTSAAVGAPQTCPGCGVRLQTADADRPGFFQLPKRLLESPEEAQQRLDARTVVMEPALAAAQPEEEPTPDWQAFNLLPEDEEQADVAPRPRETLPPPPEYAAKQVVCARCYGLQHNGRVKSAAAEALLPGFDFEAIVGARLRQAAVRTRPVVLLVVDLADFDGSFPAVAARLLSSLGDSTHVLLACTKADLLPRSASPARLEQWVRRRAKAGGLEHLHSVRFLGAPTRFGITALANALEELSSTRSGAEVWVVGAQNAGKSTLINALSAHYYGDGFQAGPVASHVPGTTLGLVRLESLLPGKRTVVDTPGLLHGHQLSGRLTPDEARIVLPRRPLRPRTYRVPHGSSVSVGGLFRVDVVDGPSSTLYLTVWASEDVPTHMGRSQGSEELFARHAGGALKPPLGAERVPELGRWAARSVGVSGTSWTASSRDVVVAGAGWAAVAVDGQAQLRVWTYEGVAVTERDALLPDLARELETPGFDFEKAGKSRGGREVRGRPRNYAPSKRCRVHVFSAAGAGGLPAGLLVDGLWVNTDSQLVRAVVALHCMLGWVGPVLALWLALNIHQWI